MNDETKLKPKKDIEMFKQLKLVASLAITATLAACGGGGDSGPTGPVASTETFAFKTTFAN